MGFQGPDGPLPGGPGRQGPDPPLFQALAHAFRAQRDLALGQDPGPALGKALAAAHGAARISASHYKLPMAIAQIHRIQALNRMAQGLDPSQDLRQARASVEAGLKINPTDFRLHLEGALVELAAAQSSARSPVEALVRAESAARAGLRIKADCPQLWLALAEACRRRTGWAAARSEAPDPWVREGREALRHALEVYPGCPEALAEQATLTLVLDPHDPPARKALAALVERNPFLRRTYGQAGSSSAPSPAAHGFDN